MLKRLFSKNYDGPAKPVKVEGGQKVPKKKPVKKKRPRIKRPRAINTKNGRWKAQPPGIINIKKRKNEGFGIRDD